MLLMILLVSLASALKCPSPELQYSLSSPDAESGVDVDSGVLTLTLDHDGEVEGISIRFEGPGDTVVIHAVPQ